VQAERRSGQEVAQSPQRRGSLRVSTHSGEPTHDTTVLVALLAPQTQAPRLQRPSPQAWPQAPQFAPSAERSAQTPGSAPHATWPDGQAHSPAVQLAPPGQARPQAPQF
jgi:hypothetical protein